MLELQVAKVPTAPAAFACTLWNNDSANIAIKHDRVVFFLVSSFSLITHPPLPFFFFLLLARVCSF